MFEKCLICETPIPPYEWVAWGTQPIDCPVCGKYRISERAAMAVLHDGLRSRHLYSGAVREFNERGLEVIIEDFERLLDSVVVPNGPVERIDRILLYVFKHMETDDAEVTLDYERDYSVAYARNPGEFAFLAEKAKELGYLESPVPPKEEECRLTVGMEAYRRVQAR